MATCAAYEICESCGATFHGESPAGLCPACLLTTAIEEGDLEEAVNGARIQDYELLNEVARGGMGIVYRARQRVPPRIVALKMILPTNVSAADAMQRFRIEAEAAASLEHDGILPIYAVGEHDGAPFYSMKFAEGGTLANRLGQFREKPREAAALVAVELLPVEKDPVNGMVMIKYLAMIAAWVGEKDLACEQLTTAVRCPTSGMDLSYGELKLMPLWDSLRGDPRFEKIVASLAPK